MRADDSAIGVSVAPLPRSRTGVTWGALGVLAFSLTVPLTRVAVADLSPTLVGAGRAVVAAALAALALALTRQKWPRPRQWVRLLVVAGGVGVGFPLLTSYALVSASASHGAVVIALLPAATAVVAALRGRERPPAAFWLMAGLGVVAALGFVAAQGGSLVAWQASDLLLVGAVIAAALGYAEGGLLARELGAWQTVSWALVLAAPATSALTVLSLADRTAVGLASPTAWAAFAYLAVVSSYLGFFAWYRGLARGPMAQVSQVQLAQPVLSLGWAVVVLGERLDAVTVLGGAAVVGCALVAVRTRARDLTARRTTAGAR